MELEERTCPSCGKTFKVSKRSKQKYDTKWCVEFKSGRLKKLTRKELIDLQRRAYRRGVEEQE